MKKELLKAATKESELGKNLSDSALITIAEEYKKTVAIPRFKNTPQIIVCPVGLVGAGKSTTLRPLCKKLGLVRLSSDEVRRLLKKRGYNYLRTIDVVKKVMQDYLKQEYSLAMDGDAISPDIRAYVNRFANKTTHIIYIHIKPPEKFILNKLKNFKHTWLFKDADDALRNYRRRKPLHKQYLPTIDFYHKFDPSRDDLDRQIASFIAKVRAEYAIKRT